MAVGVSQCAAAGTPAGFVTSAGYSVRHDAAVGLAYLPVRSNQQSAAAQVEIELPSGWRTASVIA